MSQETIKNYYELLDVTPEATDKEIDEAFKRATAMYEQESMAVYSLYTPEERKTILDDITAAYETLSHPLKRSEYNSRLIEAREKQDQAADIHTITDSSDILDEVSEIEELDFVARLKRPLVVMDDMDPLAAEQYRVLYTRIEQISSKNSYKAFAVTSAVKGEGKTITSLNLSYLMAKEFKKKVILLECDLKNPSITTSYLDMDTQCGLIDVLNGEVELKDALIRLDSSELYVLQARQKAKNSSELLGSHRMSSVLDALRTEFDYVIMDSPPILPMADINVLTRMIDGLLLVVRAGKTPKDIVRKAVNSVSNGRFIGVVLNGTDTSLKKYYY